jgi:hypothetical protein
MEIIGVVANENSQGLDTQWTQSFTASMDQGPDSGFFVVMRTSADPSTTLTAARDALRHRPGTGYDLSSHWMLSSPIRTRFSAPLSSRLISGFALIAMVLAAVGLTARSLTE